MLEDILKKYGAEEVSAMEVYSEIFSLGYGSIQTHKGASRDMTGNPLGYWKNKDKSSGHYRVMFEDTFEETLKELQEADFSLLNGISYFGRRNTQEHADRMFCMIFDLDGVTDSSLNNFLNACHSKDWDIYPLPNWIALSGHGVHLYYYFEEPIPLYPNIKIQLKAFKYALTEKMWNQYTSELEDKQFQGINQGFRVIGGKTKIEGVRVRAFKLNSHPYSLTELGKYIPEESRVDESKLWKESKLTLQEAQKKFPEWYEKRVIQKSKDKGHWTCKRDLYDWWKRQIESGATLHHRYFSIMCLAIYGVKSGIPLEEVKKDSYGYIDFMNQISPENPFTKEDVKSALECFDLRYCTFPINDIVKISGIAIQKNRRNGLKQKQHLFLARRRKEDMKLIEMDFKAPEGRPKKEEAVIQWRLSHPEGRKADCIRDLKIDRKTVSKYWENSKH